MLSIIKNTIDILFSIGLLATAILMLPQIAKLLRVKNSKDFSIISYAGFNIFQLGMLLHGIIQHDFALTVGMALAFIFNLITVILIIFYRFYPAVSGSL